MSKIPKVIHYCWFGDGVKPELINKCLDSWKKNCPNYKIIEWNEKNFDVFSNDYVKEAYLQKKWAFVSDYVRLWVLYKYGGIYFDTDVELIKPINTLLKYDSFLASEDNKLINTGIGCGCKKGNFLVKKMLDDYENIHFFKDNNLLDTTTCVIRGSKTLKNIFLDKIKDKDNLFVLDNNLYLPKDYFCPLNYKTGELNITENTIGIHWFNGSWLDENIKKQNIKEQNIRRKIKGPIGYLFARLYRYKCSLIKFYKDGLIFVKIKDKIIGGRKK